MCRVPLLSFATCITSVSVDIPVCPAHQLSTVWQPLWYHPIVTAFLTVNDFPVRYGAMVNRIWTGSYCVVTSSSSKAYLLSAFDLSFSQFPEAHLSSVSSMLYLCAHLVAVSLWLHESSVHENLKIHNSFVSCWQNFLWVRDLMAGRAVHSSLSVTTTLVSIHMIFCCSTHTALLF